MRIELDKLDGASAEFAHVYQPGEVSLDDERARLLDAAEIRGRVWRTSVEVQISGRITARVEIECDRCLRPVIVPIDVRFDVAYLPESDYSVEDAGTELQEKDLSVSFFDGEAIDVDELVREQALLALPPRVLCRADCKGLCPVCGTNRNDEACGCESAETDPRWAALAQLKETSKSSNEE